MPVPVLNPPAPYRCGPPVPACSRQDVLWRVGNSMIGVFRPNFLEVTMKNPDL